MAKSSARYPSYRVAVDFTFNNYLWTKGTVIEGVNPDALWGLLMSRGQFLERISVADG